MGNVEGFICPHCENAMDRHNSPSCMVGVATPHANGWTVYVLVCPSCRKALGSYATPQR